MKKTFASLLALAIACSPMVASAQHGVWEETNNLASTLTGPFSYSAVGTTATITYTGQTAYNTGATAQHMGMYFGWNWTYNSAGADTPMLWNNASQKFESSIAKLSVSRPSFANQFFRLGDVDNDTWVGNPWAPGGETPIATQAGWIAPLFDFGVINAGSSVNYDIKLVYEFNNASDFADFERGGEFYVGAQGVQSVVPEPSTFALVGFAFGAVAFVRRRRTV